MTVRRIDKNSNTQITKSKRIKNSATGEEFAWHISSFAEIQNTTAVDAVDAVPTATEEPAPHQRQEQLEQTRELLDSLEALGHDLVDEEARMRLRHSRDQALRTLSDSPKQGEERELLHRTALLATVELAKSDRGDYT